MLPPRQFAPFVLGLVPVAAAIACGSPQAAPAHVASVDVTPSAAAAPDAGPAVPPDVTDVTTLVAPPGICAANIAGWTGELALRVAVDGPVFANLRNARAATLSLPENGGAFVTADTGSAHVGGFVSLNELHLGAQSVVALGGFFVPETPSATVSAFTVVRSAGDKVTVSTATPDGVELLGTTAMQADVPCSDLTLAATPSLSPAMAELSSSKRARLLPKRKMTISVDPGGPPVARITTGADPPWAAIRDEQPGRLRVAWHDERGFFGGWVARADVGRTTAADALREQKLQALRDAAQFGMIGLLSQGEAGDELSEGGGGGDGAGPDAGAAVPSAERVACVQPARIVVEAGGHRYVVGRIDATAPLSIHRTDGSLTPLVAPGSLAPATGVGLFVPSREVFACGATSAPEVPDPPHGGSLTGQGLGDGSRVPSPKIRQGATSVSGRLPPEVIQRIVRQNFGRFRLCYESGLKNNPNLQGRVSTRFVIDKSGAITSVADAGSDLPDAAVVACVVRAFGNLSFPQPEAGTVTVVFPVIFSPGD